MRDLAHAPEAIAGQGSRVATEGWGVTFQNLTNGFRVTKSGDLAHGRKPEMSTFLDGRSIA